MILRKRILYYLALLPLSFASLAVVWALLAPRYLYHCWDDAIAFHPPFIHPGADSMDGTLRDYYLVPGWLLHAIWLLFIAGGFLLPAFLVRRWRRKR